MKQYSKRVPIATLAVRTRKIDDEILSSVLNKTDGYKQVVVLGAGLDTRPWRLLQFSPQTSKDSKKQNENDMIKNKKTLAAVKWFEVDFQELFDFKLPILQSHSAKPSVDYKNVVSDLSLPGWGDKLIQAGYDPKTPSLWLLEGFINYLTEEEADRLFKTINKDLASVHSRLLMTSVTNENSGNPLHRFHPSNPLAFVSKYGWKGIQTEFTKIGKDEYNREAANDASNESGHVGYCFVQADLAAKSAL